MRFARRQRDSSRRLGRRAGTWGWRVFAVLAALPVWAACANLWGFQPLADATDGGPSDAPSGPDCVLEGQETSCGTCISYCGDAGATCCGDPACREHLMPQASACAEGDAAACARIAAEVRDPDRATAALANCVEMNCLTLPCVTRSPTSRTNCFIPNSADTKQTCSCTLSPTTSNDLVCSSDAFPGTLCCAQDGWPDASPLSCSCQVLACNPVTTGGQTCSCALSDNPVSQSTCSGKFCCQTEDTCACGDAPCQTGERPVKECSLGVVGCAGGFVKVDSCSLHDG